MDFIVIKDKLFAKMVSWDLAAVEMSDQETIQKYLDGGYEPFSAVPQVKKDTKSILTNTPSNGFVSDTLIFMRKSNTTLSPVKEESAPESSELEA